MIGRFQQLETGHQDRTLMNTCAGAGIFTVGYTHMVWTFQFLGGGIKSSFQLLEAVLETCTIT